MVRQWQEMFFDNRYSFVQMQNPDFVKLGEAFGISSSRISERSELETTLTRILNSDRAELVEIVVENEQNVFPMVPAGASVADVRLE
jgi:acetolactate synthase I/II/III large subunit